MAKKQSRRSVSLSRTTYEKLRAFCESSGVSMSQFVEGRIGDFLGQKDPAGAVAFKSIAKPASTLAPRPMVGSPVAAPVALAPRPIAMALATPPVSVHRQVAQIVAAPTRPMAQPPRPVVPPSPPKPPAGPTERTKVSGTAKAKAEEIASKRTGNVFNF